MKFENDESMTYVHGFDVTLLVTGAVRRVFGQSCFYSSIFKKDPNTKTAISQKCVDAGEVATVHMIESP